MTFEMPRTPEPFSQGFQPPHEMPADIPQASVFDGQSFPGAEPSASHPDMTAPSDRGQPRMSISGEEPAPNMGSDLPVPGPDERPAFGIAGENGPLSAGADETPPLTGSGERAADRVTVPGQTETVTNDVELPENIHELLDTGLTPADMPGAATRKFTVQGHPELLARYQPSDTPENAAAAKEARDNLVSHRVDVLPSTPVEHNGRVYVVTKRVDGITLPEALADNPTAELLEQTDKTYRGLVNGLVEARGDGAFPLDITSPDQYMVGSIEGDPETKVRLVDLTDAGSKVLRPREPGDFEAELLEIADGIKQAENLAGSQLPQARRAIDAALQHCQLTEEFGNGVAEAIKWVLSNDRLLHVGGDDDVLIDRLRTDAGAIDRTAPPNGLDTAGYDAEAIRDALDDQLVEADLTPGITAKYTLRDNPDIILRQDRGVPLEDLEQAKQAADALQGYRVNVLPSDVIDHGGTPYVATVRVNGVTLEEALANNPSDELIKQVETTWKGLVDALIDCRLHNRATPNDVSGPWQYMVGTTPADDASKVRLVDLPYSAPRANEGDTYEHDLTYLAGDIIRVEQLIGRELGDAREVMEHALRLCRDTAHFGDGLKQAIAHMLDNSEIITPDEDGPNNDLIQRLRTK